MSSMFDNFAKDEKSLSRIGFIAGAIVIAIVAGIAIYWLVNTTYKPAFTGLEDRDAANIVAELDKLKIPYKVANGGSTIMVEEDKVNEARLQVMGSDAKITGGMGFEVFDGSDFGMTEFVQKINYQRALQGELSRTIGSLKEVKYARVHLVMAESSLFKKEKANASASVTLFLKQEERLDRKQIRGIQRLVAASVPGLNYGAVTVINENGEMLSQSAEDSDEETAGARLQRRQEVEAYLKRKINAILLPTFGPGNTSVSVNVDLNLDKVKTTNEILLPNDDGVSGIIRKRETDTVGSKKEKSKNRSTEIEYQVGRQIEQTIMATGVIERISVGVSVPEKTPSAMVDKVRELISASIGIDATRNDVVVVYPIKSMKNIGEQDTVAGNFGGDRKSSISGEIEMPKTSDKAEALATQQENSNAANGKSFFNLDKGVLSGFVRTWTAFTGHVPTLYEMLIVIMVLIITVLFLVALVTYKAVSNSCGPRRLNKQEKEELLVTISDWLKQDQLMKSQEGKL